MDDERGDGTQAVEMMVVERVGGGMRLM